MPSNPSSNTSNRPQGPAPMISTSVWMTPGALGVAEGEVSAFDTGVSVSPNSVIVGRDCGHCRVGFPHAHRKWGKMCCGRGAIAGPLEDRRGLELEHRPS